MSRDRMGAGASDHLGASNRPAVAKGAASAAGAGDLMLALVLVARESSIAMFTASPSFKV